MSKVNKEEIQKIAKLAKLKLSEDEVNRFENEFNAVLGYISKIQEVDVSNIETEHNLNVIAQEFLAQDIPQFGLSKDVILKNATENRTKDEYFKTSKIVNKDE